ncbi:enoyl-CoA hydratase/isomerase family protein [Chelatococcus reniformis]|uniref:Enoyl-CoA hydratase n=1 Tax=Chelatococcus reniformis TaxID=1494448 RepID=A0A916UV80_9HYPH|nr:enoyl-CoA hydratase/isomerase family protein [Chelatococcus reniformis]GGC88386.1 enoyl-CoA hydratase [Chelatococcus reniformis]
MGSLVLREDRDGCATLTLNRPDKLNALNVELFAELSGHVDRIAAETDRVGLVIVRGAGKCFSAGHDLTDIAAGEKPPRPNFQADVIERLANLPQPVISAVHGHCYTGALELALAGDLIVASEAAKFADTHARWALTPVWGMSQRLPRRVGLPKAREMMFTARTYTGRQAEAMGLANICVPDAEFDAELASLTKAILANSWYSHRANKALLLATDGLPLAAGLDHEIVRTRGRGPDMEERIAAFTAKTAKIA